MVYQKHMFANLLKVLHKILLMLRFVTLCYVKCDMAMQTVTHVTKPLKGLLLLRMRSGTAK